MTGATITAVVAVISLFLFAIVNRTSIREYFREEPVRRPTDRGGFWLLKAICFCYGTIFGIILSHVLRTVFGD